MIIRGKNVPKDTKIVIVEIGSTTMIDDIGQFRDQMKEAVIDLKNHIGECPDAEIGVAVSLAYDPIYLLKDQVVFPNQVGNYNPLIVVLNRLDIMEMDVEQIMRDIIGGG